MYIFELWYIIMASREWGQVMDSGKYMNDNEIKLFTMGPAQMYQHMMNVRSRMLPYFWTPEFSEMMLENARLTKKFMDAEESADVIFLISSGSGAMEATVMNCFDARDELLVISGGTFGERLKKSWSSWNSLWSLGQMRRWRRSTLKHMKIMRLLACDIS